MGCSDPSYHLTVSMYGNGSLPGDTVYLYRFNEQTMQFEKGDSAMLNDQQQVCFTGKYTGPEYVSVGVRKRLLRSSLCWILRKYLPIMFYYTRSLISLILPGISSRRNI